MSVLFHAIMCPASSYAMCSYKNPNARFSNRSTTISDMRLDGQVVSCLPDKRRIGALMDSTRMAALLRAYVARARVGRYRRPNRMDLPRRTGQRKRAALVSPGRMSGLSGRRTVPCHVAWQALPHDRTRCKGDDGSNSRILRRQQQRKLCALRVARDANLPIVQRRMRANVGERALEVPRGIWSSSFGNPSIPK